MSKAFGGNVTRNPVKEIGWGTARIDVNETASRWFGACPGEANRNAIVFQWHGETFSIPPGGQRILTNEFCVNQMFALGPHLAMQCHVEMTPEMISEWCLSWPSEVSGLDPLPPTVQSPEEMQKGMSRRISTMRRLADQLYSVWIGGLKA